MTAIQIILDLLILFVLLTAGLTSIGVLFWLLFKKGAPTYEEFLENNKAKQLS
ncbi:hypothetical protein [Xanthovirga aplysinae]|uniref:hypothetical protein n=1 Tax=Xanthovirga aplysinae TaxID=2529853 RepID=UPI001656DD61|nr:hypothetical protein [Xanthovirga aplysinae]